MAARSKYLVAISLSLVFGPTVALTNMRILFALLCHSGVNRLNVRCEQRRESLHV